MSAPIDAVARFRPSPRVLLVEDALVIHLFVLALVASLTALHCPPVVTTWALLR